MDIKITRHGPPSIPDEIQAELLSHSPRTFMVWNSRWKFDTSTGIWEPRWEIWKELRHSSHPLATNTRADSDRWNTEHQCWMRKLQTYHADEAMTQFAPVDRRLLIGMKMADTFDDRLWFENHVEAPEQAREEAGQKDRRDLIAARRRYYHNYKSPIVGRHVNSGWRSKYFEAG